MYPGLLKRTELLSGLLLIDVTADKAVLFFFFLHFIVGKHGIVDKLPSYLHYCVSGNNLLTPLFPRLFLLFILFNRL